MWYSTINWEKYKLDIKNPSCETWEIPKISWEVFKVLVSPQSKPSRNGVNMKYEKLDCCSEEVMKAFSILKQAWVSKYTTLLAHHQQNSVLTHSRGSFFSENSKIFKLKKYNLEKLKQNFLKSLEKIYLIWEAKVKWKIIRFSDESFDIKIENWEYRIVIDPKKCKIRYLEKYENPKQKEEEIKQHNLSMLEKYLSSINISS